MSNMPDIKMLLGMKSSEVRNYAIPGLNSSLISTVRLFECSRNHQEPITPHSHRFDFQCLVLQGEVENRVWHETYSHSNGDLFTVSELSYSGEGPGSYCGTLELQQKRFDFANRVYVEGDWYSMTAEQIHSIHFDRGTKVLFFEGPSRLNRSVILQPFVDGETVPTFEVKPWMFAKDAA